MRRWVLEEAQRVLALFMALIALALGFLTFRLVWTSSASVPLPTPTPLARIGLVAGHWGYDSGAVCPDGLQEAEINLAIARKVKALLERHGYHVDLMKEFDEAMNGYRGDVFVSLHSDSCDVQGFTGFKVARVENSAIPEEEDRLVKCLYDEYEATTKLPRHEDTITEHMRRYHAFRKIAPETPGAIIEMGFMSDDRFFLLYRQDVAAWGIAKGIICFLGNGERSVNESKV